MCWFITAGLPEPGARALEALGRARGGLGVRRSVNPSVAALFPQADVRLEVTHGWCSCALYPEAAEPGEAAAERDRARYRQKGWSEAKIQRAVEARRQARTAAHQQGLEREAVRQVRNAIAEQVRALGSVRVFAHEYQRSQDTESVGAAGRARVSLEEYLRGGGTFPPDTLVEIARDAS